MELAEEFLSKRKNKGGSSCTVPALLFKAQMDAKITHLAQPDKTLARHNALGMFYDEVGGLIDTFVETYMAHYPCSIVTEGSSIIADPLFYFEELYKTIEKDRASIKESFLQNQIDEIQQLISHTIYRLKYIQS